MKIITLTLNPAFDVHCMIPHFAPYRENLATVTDRNAGGKGVNISRALTAAGVENLALVVLGEENAPAFREALAGDGLTFRAISVPGRIRENLTVHTEDAEETRISFPGFSAEPSLLARVEEAISDEMEEGCTVTLTGRIPAGIDMEKIQAFLGRLRARGVRVVIDSRSFGREDLLRATPWLIKPNREEIRAYAEGGSDTPEQIAGAARRLHEEGVGHVMVSLGGEGALLICGEGRFHATPPRVHTVSTIGAGDSAVAGFLAATAAGMGPDEALRLAVAWGSAACMTPGTRPPRAEDIAAVLRETAVHKIG